MDRSIVTWIRLLPACVLAFILSSVLPVAAQQGTSEIRGRATDAQGAILPGVTVIVRNQNTGMFREAATHDDGSFFLSGIVPGMYEVSAELTGFKKYQRRDLRLEIGKTLTVEVQLEVGTVEEVVSVAAEMPVVDATTKQVGGNIGASELASLPTINRNFVGFVGLLPGIVPNVSTESFGSDAVTANGQDSRNNNYLLDGANNNDDVIGQRAGTQARTPLESIQEFQVITSQFDAEFGRTTGAVINAVSKQGTNIWHGSAFADVKEGALTNLDFFARQLGLEKPDTKEHQFGGTLGGPVIRDKAHFFFSLERVLIDEGITINVPARPDLNGTTTEQTRVWNTLIRFDHQLNANHTWGVRWLREYSPQFNQIIPQGVRAATLTGARQEDDLDQTVVGTLTSVLGNARVNTLRLAWTQEDVIFATSAFIGNGNRQDLLPPQLSFQTYFDQQNNTAQSRVNNGYQIENTYSWFVPNKRGDHALKFGFQYQHSTADATTQDNLNGTFTFGQNNLPFDPTNPRTYPDRLQIRVPGALRNYTKVHFLAGFAQDKWTLSDKLTLSLGLRYDLEILPVVELDNPRFPDPDAYPVDRNNLAPRVGFAYALDSNSHTVLRGGYGLFYDKTHFELINGIFTAGVFSTSFVPAFPAAGPDPGPQNGQFPTDPFLVNGPVINRALLEQMFQPGARSKNQGTVVLDDPDRRIPLTHQFTLGFERQLWTGTSLSVDYVRSLGRDMFILKDLNPGLRTTPARTSPYLRTDPNFTAAVNTPLNLGRTNYDAVQLQLEKRFGSNYSARVAYTWSNSRGNIGGVGAIANPWQLLDDMRLDLAEGPTDTDRRHNFVTSGMAVVPKTGGLNVSWVLRALSGAPFTLFNGNLDPDRNNFFQEPLAEGTYTGAGANAFEVENKAQRNGARGPGFFEIDMRLGYPIRLRSGWTLQVYTDIINLSNRANFAVPNGDQSAANFLTLTALRDGGVPRTVKFGARVAF